MNGPRQWQDHKIGKKHRKNVQKHRSVSSGTKVQKSSKASKPICAPPEREQTDGKSEMADWLNHALDEIVASQAREGVQTADEEMPKQQYEMQRQQDEMQMKQAAEMQKIQKMWTMPQYAAAPQDCQVQDAAAPQVQYVAEPQMQYAAYPEMKYAAAPQWSQNSY